jgi:hypothetical protein
MGRGNLQRFCKNHARVAAVLREEREKLGDLAEKKMYELIELGDWRAIAFYLSTVCRDRGYVLPKGAMLNTGDSNTNVMISAVNILSVPAGQFVPGESEIELDGRAVLGGRVIDSDPEKLN